MPLPILAAAAVAVLSVHVGPLPPGYVEVRPCGTGAPLLTVPVTGDDLILQLPAPPEAGRYTVAWVSTDSVHDGADSLGVWNTLHWDEQSGWTMQEDDGQTQGLGAGVEVDPILFAGCGL